MRTLPKLAINRLRERRPLDAAAVDRFLARFGVPIVEGARCTFLYRGEADEVFLIHRIFGLPDHLPLRRVRGTDLWYVVLELPEGSRVEYQLEVVRGGQRERINDPLNPRLAHSPVGSSSVCYAHGHEIPDWTVFDPEARPGSLVDMVVPSRALRRDCPVTLYLPARFRRADPGTRYPLLIVHDGGDYLRYAAAQTVLDNLIHRLDVAELVAAFVYPGDRLAEYANSAAHARFLTAELLPRLEAELPLAGTPSGRCLMGSSFGASPRCRWRTGIRRSTGRCCCSPARSPSPTSATTTAAGRCSSRWCGSSTGSGPRRAGSPTGCSSAAASTSR